MDQYSKNLRTMASEMMLAEELERKRLADELHNGPCQTLFRARLKLDQLSIIEPEAKQLGTILEEIGRMLSKLTSALSPVLLRRLGLSHALRSLVADMLQEHGLSVEVEEEGGDTDLSERMAFVLFRSVRELLINIVKHAETDRAVLSIKNTAHTLQIKVKDRGKGFDPADQDRHVESGRFGLFCIRERMEHLGGRFSIVSSPGKGTAITLTAPLESRKEPGHSDQHR